MYNVACAGPVICATIVGVSARDDNWGMENLYSNIPPPSVEEFFETLAASGRTCIERIVSHGHASAEDSWYDQEENEFVLLLKGAARLEYDDGAVQTLEPGDWLVIPPHRRHRVDWTLENTETVWLAVHYK